MFNQIPRSYLFESNSSATLFLWWHISKITSFWCQTPKEQKRGNILVIAPLTQLFLLFRKWLKIFPRLICFSRRRRDINFVNVVLVEFELEFKPFFSEQMEYDFIFAFPYCLSWNGKLCFLCLLNLPSWCISGTLNDWRNSFQTLSSPGRGGGRGLLTLCQKFFSIFSFLERRYMYSTKVVVTFVVFTSEIESAWNDAPFGTRITECWMNILTRWSLLFCFLTVRF